MEVVAGQVGLCRLFAGNGWFDCGTDSSLRITGDLTVMAWVNRRSSIVNGQICAKGSSDDYTHMYLFRHDKDGRLRLLGGNPTEDGYGFNAITPSGLVNVGSWACTAGVIEGDDIRLYVDGTEYDRPDAVSSRQSNDEAFYIARRGDGWNSMNGRVDEVQVHEVARSAAWLEVYYEMTSDPGSWAQASAEQPLHVPEPLQLLGLRYYVPQVGRFWTRDPVRDGLNLVTYVGNRPSICRSKMHALVLHSPGALLRAPVGPILDLAS